MLNEKQKKEILESVLGRAKNIFKTNISKGIKKFLHKQGIDAKVSRNRDNEYEIELKSFDEIHTATKLIKSIANLEIKKIRNKKPIIIARKSI